MGFMVCLSSRMCSTGRWMKKRLFSEVHTLAMRGGITLTPLLLHNGRYLKGPAAYSYPQLAVNVLIIIVPTENQPMAIIGPAHQ